MVSEILRRLVQKASFVGLLSGFQIGDEGIPIFLIQFVDDSLFFFDADPDGLCVLRCFLLMFKATSELRINLHKSKVLVVGKVSCMTEIVDIMGCEI